MKGLRQSCRQWHGLCALFRLVLIAAVFAGAGKSGPAGAVDQGWPREIKQDGATLVYYQPQLDSWKNQKVLKARMAVVLTLKDPQQPIAGAVWMTADTQTDLDSRSVILERIGVEKTSFSVLDERLAKTAAETAKKMIPRGPMTVSLDRILEGLKETEAAGAKNIPLKNDPPKIFVSFEPARLLIFDGQPVFAGVTGTNLQYAVNTNWALFTPAATSAYFLLDGTTWLTSDKLSDGWKPAEFLPDDFARLPADDNFKDVRENVPPKQPGYSSSPKFFVVTEPAELIVIEGKPRYKKVGSAGLQYVSNTDADLFYYEGDKNWYFLVAGRWYRSSKSLDGPWSFATADLPKVFASIPPQSPKGRVLYSVPGTPQAQESVLVAGIEQTATVKTGEAKLTVAYSGDPVFAPIEGTTPQLFYARNASVAVIKVSDTSYYACDRGVWFRAALAAGPWTVASSVPQVIYTIPPSSPVFYVTYVAVQAAPSPEVVVVNCSSGYTGSYVSYGVVFWGTGYYYPPYWHYGPYPIYYPYPYTWGAHAWYSPTTNTYYRGGAVYGPYGGFGAGASYNAATGTYKRGYGAYGPSGGYKVGQAYNPTTGAWATGAAAYGPNGSMRAGRGYNPETGTRFAGAGGTNMYGSWGAGVVSKGDQWVKGGYASTDQGSVAGIRTSDGTSVIKGENNTYVGKDGEVYRKGESGWQKYDGGAWTSVDKEGGKAPSQQPAQELSRVQGAAADPEVINDLNRESSGRTSGEQRASQYKRQNGGQHRMQLRGGGMRR